MGYPGPWRGPSYENHWYDPIIAFVVTAISVLGLLLIIRYVF